MRIESEDVVEICLPLSPTKNVWVRMHPMAQHRFGKKVYEYAWALAMSIGVRPTWAERVKVSVTRCSEATGYSDTANIITGIEKHLDALVRAGFVVDDDPKHMVLGDVRERVKGSWGDRLGPGTWLKIERLR